MSTQRPFAALLAAGLVVLVALACAGSALAAQGRAVPGRETGFPDPEELPRSAAVGLDLETVRSAGWEQKEPLLERPVDPKEYILGPGDVLGLNLRGSILRFHEITVTPEGSALIPGAGGVPLAGRTLAEGRAAILAEVGRTYRNVEVTVTLLRLRRFTVFVLGQIQAPGLYPATAVARVSEAIHLAGDILPQGSGRSVRLLRADGTTVNCDLARFHRLGDLGADPPLREGDRVFVDYRQEGLLLSGEVSNPGEFEFLEGDSLGGLIDLAGGLTQSALLDTVEIGRYEPGARLPQILKLASADHGGTAGLRAFPLQARDAVLIRTDPDWNARFTVEVKGEVLYPGIYVIQENQTTLAEVIRRAGGFTPEASLREATVNRRIDETIKDAEFDRLRNIPAADMTRSEYEYFKMRSRQRGGLMAVDFQKLFREGMQGQDILLQNGDIVVVPPGKAYVSMAGQVALPGNIPYEVGRRADDYIRLAGGYSWKAARGRTTVIRAATGEWIPKGRAKVIGPGDTIWVPEKPDRDWYGLFKDTLTTLTQLATIYLVIRSAT